MSAWTYESLRQRLASITRPQDESSREVLWVHSRLLGVAITGLGAFEIFVAGEKLRARSAIVRRHLQFDRWQARTGQPFEANRVVLPPDEHFKAVAALICVEMLRLGFGADSRSSKEVFSEVEPIVEMALRRSALSEEALIGLVGELMCLEQLLLAVTDHPELKSPVLDTWRGHQHSARDFVLGGTAIEVKTTTLASSTHVAHCLAQIEPVATDQHGEATLLLLSLGLCRTEEDGISLPESVERILDLLAAPGLPRDEMSPNQKRFLRDLSNYGVEAGEGYDHPRMKGLKPYGVTFTATYVPRLYDLTDEDIHLLRRRDLEATFVLPDRVKYGFALPDRISERNPAASWLLELRRLTREQFRIDSGEPA